MKILFYLEIHPLRNSYSSFSWVGKEIINMLRKQYLSKHHAKIDDDDIRIVVSRHYKELIDNNPDLKTIFLALTKEENDRLSFYMRDWNSDVQAINNWTSLMLGTGEVSAFYKSILDRIYQNTFSFDVVVNWSTNGAIRDFCRERGLSNVSMELGCVREPIINTVCFDACGVNGNSVIKNLDFNSIDEDELIDIKTIMPVKTKHDMSLDSLFRPINCSASDILYSSFGKNVLIPLQLKDDSNRIIFSRFDGMYGFLKEIIPQLLDAGYTCIVKPHPMANASAAREVNKKDHIQCQEYVDKLGLDSVVWLDDLKGNDNYLSLLNLVNYVVSINSSMAFEAMMLGIPTVVMGNAPFDIGGYSFDDLLEDKYSEELALKNKIIANVIYRNYLVPQALAFEYEHFVFQIRRAIRLNKILMNKGASAFTKEIIKHDNMSYIYENLNTKPLVKIMHLAHHNKYVEQIKKKSTSTTVPVASKSNVTPELIMPTVKTTPYADELVINPPVIKSSFKKKIIKLKNNPKKFFKDSKKGYVRVLSNIIP